MKINKYSIIAACSIMVVILLLLTEQGNNVKILNQLPSKVESNIKFEKLRNTNDPEKRSKIEMDISDSVNGLEYILVCPNNAYQGLENEERTTEKFLDAFKNSNNHESRLAFTLAQGSSANLKDDLSLKTNKVSDLLELLNLSEHKSLIHYYLVAECTNNKNQKLCKDVIIPNAISNDSNNGALWLEIAVYELNRNNSEGFEHALTQVVGAPNYNLYWAESITLFNDALVDARVPHHATRAIMSIGFSAALPLFNIQNLFTSCKNSARSRADISQLCIDVGVRMMNDSKTLLGKALGFALQEKVYKSLGENAKAKKTKAEKKRYMEQASQFDLRVFELMHFDQELNDYWFTQLKLFGETKSFELTKLEAIRLSSDPDYNPCPKSLLNLE